MVHPDLTLSDFLEPDCDTVIDVRSPAEFAEDSVPGAINLPVLNNEERARVGTIYAQISPFRARKIGATLVFRNAADHIENSLTDKEGGWRSLVYCWRGGQRSGSFAWMLREIGWRAEAVPGGYRTYRRLVTKALYDTPLSVSLIQLGGYTGTAKTALLPKLSDRGVQVIDLEGLAHHRGSLLGDLPGGQPSQKAFESTLVRALHGLDPSRPVVVEAESSKIGNCFVPPSVWAAMKDAPWIEIDASLDSRARYLVVAYEDILADGDRLKSRLDPLRRHRGNGLVDHWNDLIREGKREALCRSLAADHYDPSYDKSRRAHAPEILDRYYTDSLEDAGLDRLADAIAETVNSVTIVPRDP